MVFALMSQVCVPSTGWDHSHVMILQSFWCLPVWEEYGNALLKWIVLLSCMVMTITPVIGWWKRGPPACHFLRTVIGPGIPYT